MRARDALFAVAAAATLGLAACGGNTGSFVAPSGTLAQTRTNQSAFTVLPGTTASPANAFVVLPGTSPTPSASTTPKASPSPKVSPSPGGGEPPDGVPVDLSPIAQTHALRNPLVPIISSIAHPANVPGFHPEELRAAYGLGWVSASTGGVVAVVDAFDDPAAESDLAIYRSMFDLPPCTSLNGCFRKVSGGSVSAPNAGWALETALDLQMVSAVCPKCSIVLVEAKSDHVRDLAAAENLAATYHPQAISNSFYVGEALLKVDYSSAFIHPGIAITASSGDGGAAANFPANIPYVTAVGGTHLAHGDGVRGWQETPWSGTGYGCSAVFARPAWQTGNCAMRAIPDVSAVADPATGVAVYSSIAPGGVGGWMVIGGTSVGAPLVAAVYAMASYGNTAHSIDYVYAHRAQLFPFGTGYTERLGIGAPNGVAAF